MARTEKSQTLCINIPPGIPKKKSAGSPEPAPAATPSPSPRPVVRHAAGDSFCQELLQTLYDGTLIADASGRVLDVNRRAEEMLAYDRADLLQLQVADIICGTDANALRSIQQNLENRKFILIDAYCIRKDGSLFASEIAVNRFQLDQANGFIFFIRNITRRKSVEEELRRSEARNRALLDAIPDLIVRVNREGVILDFKASAGRSPQPIDTDGLGKSIPSIFPQLAEQFMSHVEKVLQTKESRLFEYQLQFNGNVHHFESRIVCSGEEEALVIVRDMTDRKQLEVQFGLSQKMEAIGQLAAGVAHEINSPVQYIGNNLQFLREAFQSILGLVGQYRACVAATLRGEDAGAASAALAQREKECDIDYLNAEVPKAIEQSLTGVERVTKLVSAMRNFSRQGPSRREPSDINAAIQATVTISRHEWKYVADLETCLASDLPPVNCVIDQINQVVLNMIVNSADAIREAIQAGLTARGRITITTQKEADCVQITISDTGLGIPAAIVHRVFDPFFTTKPVGKGTGQGLTIAHDIIVNKHGGRIQVRSEEKKGTTFVIRLPLGGG